MPRATSSHTLSVLQALFVTFLWSSSWILIKVGLEEIPAISFAALRYALAFLVLSPAVLLRADLRRSLLDLTPADWRRLSLLGVVFYALTQGAQFVALSLLPAMLLALILSFSPVAVAILGTSLLEERLTVRQWAGTAIFVAGAAVYFLPIDAPIAALGIGVAVFGMAANASGALQGRSINKDGRLHPLLVTWVSMGVGSGRLLAAGLTLHGPPRLSASGWGIVLWLAVVNTALAFTLWNHTLRHLSAVESSVINNTMSIQIAVLAWLALGESISPKEAVGLVTAALGVLLVQLSPRAR